MSSDIRGFVAPLPEKHHKVVIADSRGHGRSTRSVAPFIYDLMTSDVLALMNYLKLERASVVGWSDGGIFGLTMGIEHPERLNKLVTFGANFSLAGEWNGLRIRRRSDDPVLAAG